VRSVDELERRYGIAAASTTTGRAATSTASVSPPTLSANLLERQGAARRASTIWQRADADWKIVFHQAPSFRTPDARLIHPLLQQKIDEAPRAIWLLLPVADGTARPCDVAAYCHAAPAPPMRLVRS